MRVKEIELNKLNEIDFHDIAVKKLSIITSDHSNDILIDFCLSKEGQKNYEYLTIRFVEIISLRSGELFLDSALDMEITSFDYQWNDRFEGKLLFLLGFGKPGFELEVQCKRVQLDKTETRNEK